MKKAFTLVELMVTVTVIIAIGIIAFSGLRACNGNYTVEEWLLPEQTKAKYQREMVEEIRRANDLKERQQNTK